MVSEPQESQDVIYFLCMHLIKSPHMKLWIGGVIVLVLSMLYFARDVHVIRSTREDVSLALSPSAERAYQYGNHHFDSAFPGSYDVDRAEYLFNKAHELDPKFPYVQHQLARVEFLRGNFDVALSHINGEINLSPEGPTSKSSYYIRALINAYRGDYETSGRDYKKFLKSYPTNWAAINDYAWVLLQDDKARKAVDVTLKGLMHHPENPWLLNTNAIALYEIGMTDAAREQARKATQAIMHTDEEDWLKAYPGNDPRVASDGLFSFKDSIVHNMHMMSVASEGARYNQEEVKTP